MLLLTSLILIPLLCALIPVPERLHASLRKHVTWIPALQFLILLSLWPEVQGGEKLVYAWAWLPEMGFQLSLALDGLSWLFACLISGTGILVFYYTAFYLEGGPRLFWLYRFLLLFKSGMRGASKTFLITGSGGLVMLMGVFLTAPVGAHMIARTACRAGIPLWKGGMIDEMKAWQDGALIDQNLLSLPNQPGQPASPHEPVPLNEPIQASGQSSESDQTVNEEEVFL